MAIDANGKEYTPGKCYECRAGEHEDEDDDIMMCSVIDNITGKVLKRVRLCAAHRFDNRWIWEGYHVEITE